jgi:ABC-2 type transport system ATP-binding protein
VLQERAAAGVPVLFSSHQLELVERLCDDLVVIAGGRVRANGPKDRLRAAHSTQAWELDTPGDSAWLRTRAGITVRDFDGGWARFEADETVAQDVLRDALTRGPVRSFTPYRPSLTEIFKEVVK